MHTRSILLIDEDDGFAALLERALKPYGFAVTAAADGAEGLTAAGRLDSELIVIAVELPEKLGYVTCNKAKKGVAKHLPVVLVTSTVPPADLEQHRKLKVHADGYLDKRGLARETLLECISELVSLGESADESSTEALPLVDDIAIEEDGPYPSQEATAEFQRCKTEETDKYEVVKEEELADSRASTDDTTRAAVEPSSLSREKEFLHLRSINHERQKEILALRDELNQRDHKVLAGSERAAELERKLSQSEEQLLTIEGRLVGALERLAELEADVARTKGEYEKRMAALKSELTRAEEAREAERLELEDRARTAQRRFEAELGEKSAELGRTKEEHRIREESLRALVSERARELEGEKGRLQVAEEQLRKEEDRAKKVKDALATVLALLEQAPQNGKTKGDGDAKKRDGGNLESKDG